MKQLRTTSTPINLHEDMDYVNNTTINKENMNGDDYNNGDDIESNHKSIHKTKELLNEQNEKYLFSWKSSVLQEQDHQIKNVSYPQEIDSNHHHNHNCKIYPLKARGLSYSSSENMDITRLEENSSDYEWKKETDAIWKMRHSGRSHLEVVNELVTVVVEKNESGKIEEKDDKLVYNNNMYMEEEEEDEGEDVSNSFVTISMNDNDKKVVLNDNNCKSDISNRIDTIKHHPTVFKVENSTMSNNVVEEEEEFDLALVLESNEVYAHWAKILDFRSELVAIQSSTSFVLSSTSHEMGISSLNDGNSRIDLASSKRNEHSTNFPNESINKSNISYLDTARSLFDRAVEKLTPPSKQQQQRDEHQTTKSAGKTVKTPSASSSKTYPHSQSPTTSSLTSPDLETLFPSQKIPRGIAARNNGLLIFLQALDSGIVVKQFDSKGHHYIKLFSVDHGDTIQYEFVKCEDAHVALKEQSIRYNHHHHTDRSANTSTATLHNNDKSRNDRENVSSMSSIASSYNHNNKAILPDHIAASQYRQNHYTITKQIPAMIYQCYKKVYNYLVYRGSISTSHILVIHPANHLDPTAIEEHSFATKTLRSLSITPTTYDPKRTFSIIVPNSKRYTTSTTNNNITADDWFAATLSSRYFISIDIEAGTLGEYWLLFRGFLLLHRDASVGRYAAQRSKGISSYYNIQEYEKKRYNEKHNKEEKEMQQSVSVPPPPDYFLGFYTAGTQIWSRLRQAGLVTKRFYALDTTKVMIQVRCPTQRLKETAEFIRLKLPTNQPEGSFYTEFQVCNEHQFLPSRENDQHTSLFKSSERQTITDFIIRSRIRDNGCELDEFSSSGLGKYMNMIVPLHKKNVLDKLYHEWVLFWRVDNWISNTTIIQTNKLQNEYTHSNTSQPPLIQVPPPLQPPSLFHRIFIGAFNQPLDSIQQYYGESVALYFAWIQHCSYHLTYLSVLGIIVCICQLSSSGGSTFTYDHPILLYYSNFVMLWSFIVMITWRRRSNYLTHKWGTLHYEAHGEEITRPQYKGTFRKCDITQEWIVFYPSWKRWIMKYCVSMPLCMLFTAFTLFIILTANANRDMLLSQYYATDQHDFSITVSFLALMKTSSNPSYELLLTKQQLKDPVFWILTIGIPTVLALCLPLLNFIVLKVSMFLNDLENHRTQSQYRNHLIVKVFAFRFVCYFASLYYYCYLSTFQEEGSTGMGILRVAATLFIFLTIGHWWNLCVQIYIPHLIHKWRLRQRKKNLSLAFQNISQQKQQANNNPYHDDEAHNKDIENQTILLQQASSPLWEQSMLPIYSSFHDYVVVIVNFGYITCFSAVLPITPLIVLINNLFTLRLDAYKLCRGRRRPLAQKAGGIGVWEHCLHIVTVIAVFTNCGLIAFTTSQLKGLHMDVDMSGNFGLFIVIIGWEHVMLFIKYVLNAVISKIPKSIQDDLKREKFIIRQRRNSHIMRAKHKSKKNHSHRSHEDDTTTITSSVTFHTNDDTTITTSNDTAIAQQQQYETDHTTFPTSCMDRDTNGSSIHVNNSFVSPIITKHSKSKSSLRRRGQRSSNRSCSKSPLKPNYLRLSDDVDFL